MHETEPHVIVVSGDEPDEHLGRDVRARMRLTVDGEPASLRFLREYFRSARSTAAAKQTLQRAGLPFVSLNGPCLAQTLAADGYRVTLVPSFRRYRRLLDDALAAKPLAAVLSTTFLPFAAQVDGVAAHIKERAPDTLVVAGGPQVWKSFQHLLLDREGGIPPRVRGAVAEHNYLLDPGRRSPVDVLVLAADGRGALRRLLALRRAGRPPGRLPNTAVQRDGRWCIGAVTPEDDGACAAVDWSRALKHPTELYVPVQAGTGCAFRCAFCDFRGLTPLRRRPAAAVVAEIRGIPPLNGVRRVYFTDDNLFADAVRARAFCRALRDARLGLRWRGMARVSAMDEETVSLMAASGCREVLLGVESGDAGMLRRMGKRSTPESILAAVGRLSAHGIHTKSTLIVGFPGETDASLANTVDLLNAYPTDGRAVHRYLFFTFAALPLAPVFAPASRARYRLEGYGYQWRHATMDADEAARKLAAALPRLKPELSPSYVLEVPDLPGLCAADIRAVYRLRNLLAARQRTGVAAGTDAWDELAARFAPSLHAPPAAMPLHLDIPPRPQP